MLQRFTFLLLLALPAVARAEATELAVGETVKVDVGIARGVTCDDVSIVSADITTDETTKSNTVILKGLTPGETDCRAGNAAFGKPSRFIHVKVHAKAK